MTSESVDIQHNRRKIIVRQPLLDEKLFVIGRRFVKAIVFHDPVPVFGIHASMFI
jgi:hypothetical protein